MTRRQRAAVWLTINGLGAAAYVAVASWSWVEPELADVPEAHGGGAAIVWGLTAVPLFLAFVLLNASVLIWAARRRRGEGVSPFTRAAWLIPVVWACAVVVDFAHH